MPCTILSFLDLFCYFMFTVFLSLCKVVSLISWMRTLSSKEGNSLKIRKWQCADSNPGLLAGVLVPGGPPLGFVLSFPSGTRCVSHHPSYTLVHLLASPAVITLNLGTLLLWNVGRDEVGQFLFLLVSFPCLSKVSTSGCTGLCKWL